MPKRFDIDETPFGLCSDPDTLKAPKGALAECTNCIINRDGIVEPRNGADEVDLSSSNLTYAVSLFNYDGDLALYDTAGGYWEFLGNLGNLVQDEDGNDPVLFGSYHNVQEARGNLYVACTDGVRKITSSDSTDIFKAGVIPDVWTYLFGTQNNTDYNWWTTATYIRYVATVQKKDANDVVLESPPSLSECARHTDGADRVPRLYIYIGQSVAAGDVVRVFRTKMASSGQATGATFYLVYEHTVTSSDVSTGYIVYDDIKDEADLSESLYTNPENEGVLQSNFRPPAAKCLELYKGSMFFSNVIEPPRVNFRVRTMGNRSGESEYAAWRQETCSHTDGSPIITVGDGTGIEVGQLVNGFYFPENTYVAAVSGTTITATENATYTGSGITIIFEDTITFGYGSTYETFSMLKSVGSPYYWGASGLAEYMMESSDTEYAISSGDYTHYRIGNIMFDITIERRTLNSAAFYVWATHGESYEPVLSGPTYSGGLVFSTANGLQSDMLTKPNRQYWSKNNQPEHVPIVNYHDIGDGSAIIQTVETKDGMIVFKDDGIYTVTGDGARSGWSVRLLDKDNVLTCAAAAVHADGYVYAMTNHGFVRVNVYGVEKISTPFIDDSFPVSSYTLLGQVLFLIKQRLNGESVRQHVVHDKRGNNIIALFDDTNDTAFSYALVYNLKTKAFTSWSFSREIFCLISADHDGGYLYYGGRYTSSFDSESSDIYLWKDNDLTGADHERSVTVDTKPDSTTINFTTAHYAEVGDYIVDGTEQQEILTVVDSDSVTVADNSSISGACKIYTPIDSVIKWLPKFGETRAFRKKFVAYGLIFRVNPEIYSIQLVDGGSTYGPFDLAKTTERKLVPIANARELFLEPKITITDLVNSWQLTGLSLEYFLLKPRGV